MSLQYLKKELNYEADILHTDKHESFLQVHRIIFDGFGQECPNCLCKFAISVWHLKKEGKNDIRDLTAMAGANIVLKICYTSNVLPPLALFPSHYRIHTKPFLDLINCLCSISSLLFQVMVGPSKLICLFDLSKLRFITLSSFLTFVSILFLEILKKHKYMASVSWNLNS